MNIFTKILPKQFKSTFKLLLPGLVLSLVLTYQIFESKGEIFTLFAPITISDQVETQVLYNGDLEITLDMLTIDYSGDKSNLNLEILSGTGYSFSGQTIDPNVTYDDSWEAEGKEITVNIQVSDGVDVSETYPFKVLVIPLFYRFPILKIVVKVPSLYL